jgi:cytochrome c
MSLTRSTAQPAYRCATAPGYVYSEALKKMDIVWTAETISKLFEAGPTLYTPGTKMPEQRITDPADRLALIDWLARVAKP